MRQFFAIFLKTLLYLVLTVLGLVLGILLSLQLPAVQTRLAQKGAKWLSEKLLFPVDIQGVSIKWFDSLTLEGVRITDRKGQPMITVGRLDANYDLKNLLDSSAHNLHLDEIVLYKPDVRMIKNLTNGDTNLDDFIARIEELTADPTKPSVPNQNVPFKVSHIHLVDGAYTLEDPREPFIRDPKSFDYNHFTLQHLTAEVSNFLVLGDTIAFDAKGLSGIDRDSRIRIRQLDTRFLYCNTKMELGKLYAHIGNSVIRNELTFLYDKPSAFGDFNSRVLMQARFRDSKVLSKDLGFFSEYLRGLNETWYLTGNFSGTVNDFRLNNTDLRFGPNGRSRLAGNIAWKGLPDMDKTTVNFAFAPSVVNMADIRQYYPDSSFNHTIQKLGTASFNATFVGTFDDFKTKGTFQTAIGNVTGDLALKLATKSSQTTYTANLRSENLDLGQLINQPDQFGKLDGEGRIAGHGTDLKQASIDFNGQFGRFGWQGYEYKNVEAKGNLQQAIFEGQLHVHDPNLAFELDGLFNLKAPSNRYDFRGTVQHADLRALGYLSDSLVVKTGLDIRLEGSTLDDIVGTATFDNATLTLNRRNLNVDKLTLFSSTEQELVPATDSLKQDAVTNQRYFNLDSDFLTTRLQGTFQPQRTIDDLKRIAREYQLYFKGDAAGMKAYYDQKRQQVARLAGRKASALNQRYGVDYQVITKNSVPLLDFLGMSAYIAPTTRLEGRFMVDNTSFLTAAVKTDSVRFGTISFGPSDLDLTTSKFVYDQEVLASAVISSKRQLFSKLLPTRNLQVEASWDVDHIDFTSDVEQADSSGKFVNHADLNGELRFKGDAIDLTFRQSKIRVLDGDWVLNPQSLIRKVGEEYTIRNLSLLNENQLVQASGKISPDSVQNLDVEAQNFLLASLNPLLNTDLGGTLNGKLAVRNLYDTPIIESSLAVIALSYDKALIGDVHGQAQWDQMAKRLNVDARINRSGADVLTLIGTYTPQLKSNPLSLKANVNNADLSLLEPFTTDLFSNLGGIASGVIAVRGTPAMPVLMGQVGIKGGRGRFDYLKADFSFDDNIYFGENEIIIRQLTLRDPQGNTALLRGGVYHEGFRYFTLGFDADFKNFKILNTAAKDNDAFYGQAVVTGKAELYGPTDNLTIRANVTSNKGTRIFIPLDGATTVADDEQIRFVNLNGTSSGNSTNQSATRPGTQSEGDIDLSRIQMDFNFNITPDAYCEIQLDRQTGDIIKAYGQGLLSMKVDTKGDFTMTGNYEILKGDYTFTFQNIINKRFQIRPNSRITWTGDPYGALLDVTAAYTQYTSLAPLLAVQKTNTTADQSRRYPVDLVIKLNGELGSPAISYDLDIKEYPSSSDFRQAVTAFESRLQSNDQELTRQVSSVLLFNQLLSENTSLFDQGQVNSGVANSVSELLSNQISRLASNLNENLDIGVSFGGFTSGLQNENLLNNLQLRFSYRLLNDRLRISRDGGFTYGQSQYNAASLLGEWTLEYFITSDGRLRAKVYNRNQQSILGQYSTNSTISTGGGLSLLYTRSFNHLFDGKRNAPGLTPNLPADETPVPIPTPITTSTTRGREAL
ncbi:translocation/assembly module TamB domain-containing protein [Spirosoma validum]|uniref:Translocation/assembly module TamB domain-containing protein n=1 Tax=Spirosoma validum TaxID=2771355 RepID=A0A927GCN0_9BACT|nr:translocation/assembly module TamB domain-containing protein [Spirosoma validum]MBD2752651.1 translocation/assembly module TamB domain-containing protein [Spirosoma validum]